MDQINDMLAQINQLDEAGLADLESQIISQFEMVEQQELTAQHVETLDALANAAETVRTEQTRRAEEAESLANRAAEAAARVRGADDQASMDTPEEGEDTDEEDVPVEEEVDEDDSTFSADTTEAEAEEPAAELATEEPATTEAEEPAVALATETPAEAELSADTPAESELSADNTNPNDSSEVPMTAASQAADELVIEPPAENRPTPKQSAQFSITAGADIPGLSAGAPIADMMGVAEAFTKRLHTLRRVNGGDGEQHIVASIQTKYPDERQLLAGSAEDNGQKIFDVIGQQALVAAGGWVAPLETRYDIFDTGGTTARPVRDALARFTADRGGIRYVVPPTLPSMGADIATGGISIWTAANDASPADPAVKPTYVVEGITEDTATVDAVTLSMQFGNLVTRAYPELVARYNELALIQHARVAENNLLSLIKTDSLQISATRVLGAARDFLLALDRAAAGFRHRHRLDASVTMRAIAPLWMKDILRADIAMQMPGDGLEETLNLADSKIEQWLRARRLNVTWHLDGTFPAQAAGALVDFPTEVEWCMFTEGSWLFLDGGTLDLGIIRDSTLVGTNDYKMFVETFEGAAKVGAESVWVTSTLEATGAAAALVDTTV